MELNSQKLFQAQKTKNKKEKQEYAKYDKNSLDC